MKCGTTAIRHIVKQCPNVVKSKALEPHYFDTKRVKEILNNFTNHDMTRMTDEEACYMRRDYLTRKWNVTEIREAVRISRETNVPVHVFEKTPAYIRSPGMASAVHRLLGDDVKIIALFRDPVSRFYSDFKWILTYKRRPRPFLPQTVDEMVQLDIQCLKDANLTRAPTLREYIERKGRGEVVPDSEFRLWEGLTLEDKHQRMYELIRKNPFRDMGWRRNMVFNSMYSLQLAQWLEYFQLGKNLKIVQFEVFQTDKQRSLEGIFDFMGLPLGCLSNLTQETLDKRAIHATNFSSLLSNETKEYLWRFYKPYNEELADMLGEDWPRQY